MVEKELSRVIHSMVETVEKANLAHGALRVYQAPNGTYED